MLFPILFQPSRAYLDKQFQSLDEDAAKYISLIESVAAQAQPSGEEIPDSESLSQSGESAFMTPHLGPAGAERASQPRTPLSPRSPYSPPRSRGMASPSGGGMLSPSAITRFLQSIRIGRFNVSFRYNAWLT